MSRRDRRQDQRPEEAPPLLPVPPPPTPVAAPALAEASPAAADDAEVPPLFLPPPAEAPEPAVAPEPPPRRLVALTPIHAGRIYAPGDEIPARIAEQLTEGEHWHSIP